MSPPDTQYQLEDILIAFSTQKFFSIDESISDVDVDGSSYCGVLEALSAAMVKCQGEIKSISQNEAKEVDNWIAHTKSIQLEINDCQNLANSVARHFELSQQYLEEVKQNNAYLSNLKKESIFNDDLLSVLRDLQRIYNKTVEIENLVAERKFMDSLLTIEDAYESSQRVFQAQSIRIVQKLELKFSDQRKSINEELLRFWKALVHTDTERKIITIHKIHSNGKIKLNDVIACLDYFGDLKSITKDFCNDLDSLILKPRTKANSESLPSIQINDCTISLGSAVDRHINTLFFEVKELVQFLGCTFPAELNKRLLESIMLILSDHILREWLDQTVPFYLNDLISYHNTLSGALDYIRDIESSGWLGFDGIRDWIENFPKIWLNKRRETTLECLRNNILMKVESPPEKEKVEERINERKLIDRTSAEIAIESQDWDAAWNFDEDIKLDESEFMSKDVYHVTNFEWASKNENSAEIKDNLDDIVDAWGWGDEGVQEDTIKNSTDAKLATQPDDVNSNIPSFMETTADVEKMSIAEHYWISQLPRSIMAAIIDVYKDCATLSLESESPVFPTMTGLLNFPTQILAMYRAISPSYYAYHKCGNAFRYNDSFWLAVELREYIKNWNYRIDIPTQFRDKYKIKDDIAALENFGKQACSNELSAQISTIISILGGSQNLFRQEILDKDYTESKTSAVISHIREQSMMWKSILRFSTWASMTGTLVNTVAIKIIKDVFDLKDISIKEAENTAAIISKVENLDMLFLPRADSGLENQEFEDEVPLTAKFTDKWMKMKFLGEVLKSNLKDIKFLWFESDLSLYFSVEETVGLIHSSFDTSTGVRQVIKEIRDNPRPKSNDF